MPLGELRAARAPELGGLASPRTFEERVERPDLTDGCGSGVDPLDPLHLVRHRGRSVCTH